MREKGCMEESSVSEQREKIPLNLEFFNFILRVNAPPLLFPRFFVFLLRAVMLAAAMVRGNP